MASSLRVNSIIPSSGTNVAIGTAGGTVTYNASVSGISTFSSGIVVSAGSTSAPSISPTGDSNTGIFFPSADTVCIGEGGTEVIRVDSSGNVGINTTTFPANGTNLKVSNDTFSRILLDKTGTNARSFSVGNGGTYLNVYDETADAERLRIDSSGRVTEPYQVSFAARVATTQTNVTGNAVYFTLVADSTSSTGSHNVGSHYSTSTGVFTAPVTGRYYFNTHVLYDNSVLTRFGELWLSYNNDSTRWFLDRRYWASGSNITAIGGSVVINVTAGDNIRVKGFVAGGSQDVDVQGSGEPVAHFSGYLLG
jgi:hypothetical protein